MSAAFALDRRFRPFSELHPRFSSALDELDGFPDPESYDALARQVPQAADVRLPRFVAEDRAELRRQGGYEQHVARLSAVPTRPRHWHDFFNMTVWAHFPQVRWALNALHVDPQVGPKDPRNGRAPAQNLAATFDEAGMLVVSSSHRVLSELRALRFEHVFWQLRAELLETTRFWVIGHGLLESLLTPHPRLVARSLLLHTPAPPAPVTDDDQRSHLDAVAAEHIAAWRHGRTVLDPLPVLAIPGFSDNDRQSFYQEPKNLVFEPISRRPRQGANEAVLTAARSPLDLASPPAPHETSS